ncbi:hypothetical protein H6G27_34280 [Nostoc linckia FACHB-104]|nr:hypothetical protein [Nostoc linckia FACHB-104]
MKSCFTKIVLSVFSGCSIFTLITPTLGCEIGEKRIQNPATTLSLIGDNCLIDCEPGARGTGSKVYTADDGWAIVRYDISYRKKSRLATDVNVDRIAGGTNYINNYDFQNMNSVMGQVNAIDPRTGQPIQVGGSYKAEQMQRLHNSIQSNKNTIIISGSVRGERGYGANGYLTADLITEEICIGTANDYQRIIRQEIAATAHTETLSSTPVAISNVNNDYGDPDLTVNILNGSVLKYYRNQGVGEITSPNGQVIKSYSGWRTNWYLIHPLRRNMVMFYDANQGYAEIYYVDVDGTFRDLQHFNRVPHNIVDITNLGNNIVRISYANGQNINYNVMDNGTLNMIRE